jgi:hypothetical protein
MGRVAKRLSLREAIDTFCRECIYDPDTEGSWKKQVRDCTAPKCPLYKVRPGRRTKE